MEHPTSWGMSSGPAAAADCSSHWPAGCPGAWLWAWAHPHSLFGLILQLDCLLALIPSLSLSLPHPWLHLDHGNPPAPIEPPYRPNAAPVQPSSEPWISTYQCSSMLCRCVLQLISWYWGLNPHSTSEVWSILFSSKHYGKGQYGNLWWSVSRNSISCSDKMLRFFVDGPIWLMTIWSTDKAFTLVSTFLINTYLSHWICWKLLLCSKKYLHMK